ncbi:hypothetical protein ElyMa_005945400 [Elysia marginata]|uniref:Uncharacterized protein n=1 Tax=Elysia marginata TaxID=1093978 RepID=A0AAV4G9V7_9GAST|nr:hypothetical protein ElyMa_005945400 [Elysia marginata]
MGGRRWLDFLRAWTISGETRSACVHSPWGACYITACYGAQGTNPLMCGRECEQHLQKTERRPAVQGLEPPTSGCESGASTTRPRCDKDIDRLTELSTQQTRHNLSRTVFLCAITHSHHVAETHGNSD